MKTFEEERQAEKVQRHLAKQEQIFNDWLAVNPKYNNMANVVMLKRYYNGDDWSYEDLDQSAALLAAKDVITPLVPKTSEEIAEQEWEERVELVNFILETGKYQPESIKPERDRLLKLTTSIETLRQMKANLDTQHRLSSLSKDQLKAQVRQEWVDQAAAKFGRPGVWKPLPEIMRSRSMLLAAPPDEMRTLIRTCGVDQINFYLSERTKH
jgi:hypothetical protein